MTTAQNGTAFSNDVIIRAVLCDELSSLNTTIVGCATETP